MSYAKTILRAASLLIIYFCFHVSALPDESTGQKAHFQVEDKSGDLNIQATKDLAKVTAQADSVDVVVKPGTADYPILQSDKPIVHVVPPQRRSELRRIGIKKKSLIMNQQQHPQKPGNNIELRLLKTRTTKPFGLNKEIGTEHHNHKMQRHKTHKKPLKWSSFYNNQISSFNSKKLRMKEKLHNNFRVQTVLDSPSSRKSVIKDNESGFTVSGNAGKIKMKVTKTGTDLESNSGTVDIMLKRPVNSQSTSASSNRSVQPKQQIHIAPDLEMESNVGLKKSEVIPVKH